jgi:hypothetical protein
MPMSILESNTGFGLLGCTDTFLLRSGAVVPETIFPLIGDSNCVGIGVATTADRDFAVTVSNPAWKINSRYAASVSAGASNTYTDYPSNRVLADGSLYASPGSQCMGFEMTMGPALVARGVATPIIPKWGVVGSTLAVEWNPTGSYPAAGAGNLFNLMIAQMLFWQTNTGKKIGAVTVSLGTNDAANSGQASAFQANMGTFCTAIRTALSNASLIICWIKTNPDVAGNAFTSTVISQQVAYAATDPLCLLIDQGDTLLVSDHLHNTDGGYCTVGSRIGHAIATAKGIAPQAIVGAPDWVGFGPIAASTTDPVGVSYGGEINGDLQVATLRLQLTGASVPTATAPSGWTEIGHTSSTSSGVTIALYVYKRPVTTALINANNGHMPPTTFVNDHVANGNAVKIYTLRGPSLNPTVDAFAFTASNTIGTGPVTVPALATGAANTRVALFTGGFAGSASTTMTETNGTLVGFSEFSDCTITISANNNLHVMASGSLAAAGSSGTFAASSSAGVIQCNAVISFKP